MLRMPRARNPMITSSPPFLNDHLYQSPGGPSPLSRLWISLTTTKTRMKSPNLRTQMMISTTMPRYLRCDAAPTVPQLSRTSRSTFLTLDLVLPDDLPHPNDLLCAPSIPLTILSVAVGGSVVALSFIKKTWTVPDLRTAQATRHQVTTTIFPFPFLS